MEFAEFSSKEDEMLKFGEMNNLAMAIAIEIRTREGLIYICQIVYIQQRTAKWVGGSFNAAFKTEMFQAIWDELLWFTMQHRIQLDWVDFIDCNSLLDPIALVFG